MPEITQADRERFQEWHDLDATLAPIDASDKQRLLECFAAHREAAVAAYIATTPPAPADSPLTEEAVKAMLPVRDGAYRTNTATYLGKFGSIEWIDLHSGFLLYVSGRLTQLSELTAAKLAALIAALGIDAGVKHG